MTGLHEELEKILKAIEVPEEVFRLLNQADLEDDDSIVKVEEAAKKLQVVLQAKLEEGKHPRRVFETEGDSPLPLLFGC